MKRLFALLLAVMMIFTLVPITAAAQEMDVESGSDSEDDSFTPADGDRLLGDIWKAAQDAEGDDFFDDDEGTAGQDGYDLSDEADKKESDGQTQLKTQEAVKGSLSVEFAWVSKDYRNSMQYSSGKNLAWLPLPYWAGGSAALLEGGREIESFTDQAQYTFSNLNPGKTYTLRITVLDRGY